MGMGQPILYRMMHAIGKLCFGLLNQRSEFIENKISGLWIKEGNNEQCFGLQLEDDHGDWGSHLLLLVREFARQVENFGGYRLAGRSSDALPHWLGLRTLYVNKVHPY